MRSIRFFLVAVFVILALRPAEAASNSWSPTGSLSATRHSHTMTTLANGKVLAAGGCLDFFCNTILRTAELYDPAAGTWSSAGLMSVARVDHTAVLLPSGKVLVAGGCASQGQCASPHATSELYDPATNTWTPTAGSLAQGREEHAAALLGNGKVLVAGGKTVCTSLVCQTTATAESYDPGTGSWSAAAPMPGARVGHTLTALANGDALLVGGCLSTGLPCSPLQPAVYGVAANSWSGTAPMVTVRTEASAIRLNSGKVLVAGGVNSGGFLQAQAETYDPATAAWSAAGVMEHTRLLPSLALLTSGSVLAAGGDSGAADKSTELYNPAFNQWTSSGALATDREHSPLAIVAGGDVLIAGGMDETNDVAVATAEIYQPGAGPLVLLQPDSLDFGLQKVGTVSDTRTITATNTGTAPLIISALDISGNNRFDFTANSGCLRVEIPPGGECEIRVRFAPKGINPRAAVLNLVDNGPDSPQSVPLSGFGYLDAPRFWSPLTSMNRPRAEHTLTPLSDGRILAAGGAAGPSAEVYDVATDRWVLTNPMTTTRSGHTATLLADNRVLVAGGGSSSAEIYDPATNTWTPTGTMSTPRSFHTATRLVSGLVLVAGGCNGNVCASSELFNPATGLWSAGAVMQTPRVRHTATLLNNGAVLIAGGSNLPTSELYNPASGFSLSGATGVARAGHTASLLPDGNVMIAGGCGGDPCFTAEIYAAPSATWSLTGKLVIPRVLQTATSLPNGQVVAASGIFFCDSEFGFCFNTASAEIFHPGTRRWSVTFPMIMARRYHAAVLLPSGQVMVAGGLNDSFEATSGVEVLTPPQ